MTVNHLGPDRRPRTRILVTALAIAIATAALLAGSGWQAPLAIGAFLVAACSLVVPRSERFGPTCRLIAYLLSLGYLAAFAVTLLYVVFVGIP